MPRKIIGLKRLCSRDMVGHGWNGGKVGRRVVAAHGHINGFVCAVFLRRCLPRVSRAARMKRSYYLLTHLCVCFFCSSFFCFFFALSQDKAFRVVCWQCVFFLCFTRVINCGCIDRSLVTLGRKQRDCHILISKQG